MKRISLFGSGELANSAVISRQRRLNCFFEFRKDGDKQQIVIRGTPGVVGVVTLPNAPIRGWHVVASALYVVAGIYLYKILPDLSYSIVGNFDVTSTGNVGVRKYGANRPSSVIDSRFKLTDTEILFK